ncbi:MAG: SMC-Scp complex subunit ScpB [Dokdonella sp.]
MPADNLKKIIEAALLAAPQPLTRVQMTALFDEAEAPGNEDVSRAIEALQNDCAERGVELVEIASGWRYQVKQDVFPWVTRMWSERPPRYSRALLETLALIAYRQPITRGEIEQIRGVSVSTHIVRTLEEREWIRVVGHRDVPGRPALFGTSKGFLDYFNLKSLDQLPALSDLRDIEELNPQLMLEPIDMYPQDGATSLRLADLSVAAQNVLDDMDETEQVEDASVDDTNDNTDNTESPADIAADSDTNIPDPEVGADAATDSEEQHKS